MLNLNPLPDFQLANEDGDERSFRDFLADYNVVMLIRSNEAAHGPVPELLRSFVAGSRGADGISVRGIEIRSYDGLCDRCCGPHVVFRGRELVTVCDSGGLVRRLWGVESDAWILIINADRSVIDDGPLAEVERLAMQFSLNAAAPHSTSRSPPRRRYIGWREAAA